MIIAINAVRLLPLKKAWFVAIDRKYTAAFDRTSGYKSCRLKVCFGSLTAD